MRPVLPAFRPARQRAIRRNADRLPTPAEAVEAVLSTYLQASVEQEDSGLHWYRYANATACSLAEAHGLTVDQTAGVLAALSPQLSWGKNIAEAVRLITTDKANQTEDPIRKGRLILQGIPPQGALGGRKVRSFYVNIRHPDRPGPVTVDRHATGIVLGRPVGTGPDYRQIERIGVYALCAAAYRGAARELHVLPHEAQAVAWTVWRDQHAPAYSSSDPF